MMFFPDHHAEEQFDMLIRSRLSLFRGLARRILTNAADLPGCSANTLYQRIHKAKELLRKNLSHELPRSGNPGRQQGADTLVRPNKFAPSRLRVRKIGRVGRRDGPTPDYFFSWEI